MHKGDMKSCNPSNPNGNPERLIKQEQILKIVPNTKLVNATPNVYPNPLRINQKLLIAGY